MDRSSNNRSSCASSQMAESYLDSRKSSNVIEMDENNIPQIDEIILDDQDNGAFYEGMEGQLHRFSLLQSGLRRNRRFASLREPAQHKHLLQVPGQLTPGGKSRSITFTCSTVASKQHPLQFLSPKRAKLPGRSRSMCGRHTRHQQQHYLSSDRIFNTKETTMKEELGLSFSLKELSKSGNISASTSYLREQITSVFQPSDNKLAMKLFGNKAALMKEKQRQKDVGTWVIHPCSNFRFYWDLFMLVLLIINLVTLPVAITFFHNGLSSTWIIFNAVSDTVFLLDLIINFRTGIITDKFADEIILEPMKIATHYFKSWFILDFLSSVPLDHFILLFSPQHDNLSQIIHAGRALRFFRLVKLLSLLKLLRLSRLVRYVSQWEEFISVAGKFMRIFNLISFILLLGHWNGCLQWLVPMLQDFPSNSWPALEELQNVHWLEQYTWSLFKALSHMLCIGFGRFPPQSSTDVWLTMVSMLTGAICYALFVGHSTTIIQSFDTAKRLYREKFKQVEEYMMYRKLPKHSRQKISDYYHHRYRGKMFDEKSILSEMSECLREDIINYNCRDLVAAVPFFTHADPNFVTDVVTKLEFEVYQPEDYIIRESTIGTKMYFIQEGIVDIVTKDGDVATSLSDGSYFGEICLLTNSRRMASVRCETYCNLFSLSVENFNSVLYRYPLMRRTLESVAAERLNKIGRNPGIVCTRMDDIDTVNQIILLGSELKFNVQENVPKAVESKHPSLDQVMNSSIVIQKTKKLSKKRLRRFFKPRLATKCNFRKSLIKTTTKNICK